MRRKPSKRILFGIWLECMLNDYPCRPKAKEIRRRILWEAEHSPGLERDVELATNFLKRMAEAHDEGLLEMRSRHDWLWLPQYGPQAKMDEEKEKFLQLYNEWHDVFGLRIERRKRTVATEEGRRSESGYAFEWGIRHPKLPVCALPVLAADELFRIFTDSRLKLRRCPARKAGQPDPEIPCDRWFVVHWTAECKKHCSGTCRKRAHRDRASRASRERPTKT